MIVTVVPEIAHFAEFAVAGTVEAPSIDAKLFGVTVNAALAVKVQVVLDDMLQDPISPAKTGWKAALLFDNFAPWKVESP